MNDDCEDGGGPQNEPLLLLELGLPSPSVLLCANGLAVSGSPGGCIGVWLTNFHLNAYPSDVINKKQKRLKEKVL